MTEPTDPFELPEGWEEGETESLRERILLVAHRVGVGDVVAFVDPDDEGPGNPAGMERCAPVALLDLLGHLHPGPEAVALGSPACIPAMIPLQFDLEALDELIDDLQHMRKHLADAVSKMEQGR